MAISFRRERTDTIRHEAVKLLQDHWNEIAKYKDIPVEPDWAKYYRIEELGNLRVFTVRSGMDLVGYAVFFLSNNPHYASSFQATQDVLFLRKDQRGFTGAKFIKWCDAQLKMVGVQAVYHHTKKEQNFGPMLERMGYELVDLVYARRLDK